MIGYRATSAMPLSCGRALICRRPAYWELAKIRCFIDVAVCGAVRSRRPRG